MPRFALGSCGSGKSVWLRKAVAAALRSREWGAARFVVLDTAAVGLRDVGEWPGPEARGTPQLTIHRTRDAAGAAKALDDGARYVIVRPKAEDAGDDAAPWGALGDELAGVIGERGQCVLVLPEAQKVIPEGRPPGHRLASLAHEHRHIHCDLWMDSQQAAYVKKEILTACNPVAWFRCKNRDRKYAVAEYGDEVAAVLKEVCKRNKPGWHALIDTDVGTAVLVNPSGRVVPFSPRVSG